VVGVSKVVLGQGIQGEESEVTAYKDPAGLVTRSEQELSYLGKLAVDGWSVEISPKLTNEEWNRFAVRADEAYNEERSRYDSNMAYDLLRQVFPCHTFEILTCICIDQVHPHPKPTIPDVLRPRS
jgi:hypothetical protein